MERFTWEDLYKKCWVNFQDVQTSISQYLFQMAKKYLLRLATDIGFSCSFLELWFIYKDHILKNKFHLGLKKKEEQYKPLSVKIDSISSTNAVYCT